MQPYLISEFRYDPLTLVKAFPGPMLVINGSTDIQVPPSDGQRLSQARASIRHRVIPDMNHIFKRVPTTDRSVQLPSYMDPSVPLHPELTGDLLRFLQPLFGMK